ncbi:hypothetical protein ACNHKD_15505 [Methylocystis sp. JAN1]|uniref:hypothetical protein n=1 Tax=Methylocystis sp. JAN1 TaxID=3397211 RepID=UPI003FA27D33
MAHPFRPRFIGTYAQTREKRHRVAMPLSRVKQIRRLFLLVLKAGAAQFGRKRPADDDVVVDEDRTVLQRGFEHRPQAFQQGLVVARNPFAQRLAHIIVRAPREVADNDRYEPADTHALLLRGHTDALCEPAPNAHQRSLGDHLVGAGMDQIRNQHGVLRFSFLFQPVRPLLSVAPFPPAEGLASRFSKWRDGD